MVASAAEENEVVRRGDDADVGEETEFGEEAETAEATSSFAAEDRRRLRPVDGVVGRLGTADVEVCFVFVVEFVFECRKIAFIIIAAGTSSTCAKRRTSSSLGVEEAAVLVDEVAFFCLVVDSK